MSFLTRSDTTLPNPDHVLISSSAVNTDSRLSLAEEYGSRSVMSVGLYYSLEVWYMAAVYYLLLVNGAHVSMSR